MKNFDLVVIGSGPSGQKAAIQAAKLGKRVVVIEQDAHLGGASLNSGTVPSKALREAILDVTNFYSKSFYANDASKREISINSLNYRLHRTLEEMRKNISIQFQKNKIEVLHGSASFLDPHRVKVLLEDGSEVEVEGSFFLIASGSRPRNPLNVPFDEEVILDSTRLLKIDVLPKTLLVLGGGIIGAEYASFFAALGTEVTVVDRKDHLLPLLDHEIGLHLQESLAAIGLKVVGQKQPKEIWREGGKGFVRFQDESVMQADMILYALGREANISGLQVERAKVEMDDTGHIAVNTLFQTSQKHIYAAGDVIGAPALASTSMEQGRLAACHAFGAKMHEFPSVYPIGIYTIPEISSCGYTEQQLQERGFRYQIGRAYYYEIARNQIIGNDPGMFKLLFHADTLEILGIHVIGRAATEVIHIGQVAMSFRARVDYFVDQVFNYPTFAEGYRIAALNGLNKMRKI